MKCVDLHIKMLLKELGKKVLLLNISIHCFSVSM